jgi:AcrR family transcriptional regulator
MAKTVRNRKRGRQVAEPRREPEQERGEKRVEELLDAAAEVIAKVGVAAATTNAIAEQAGASVGSLYHFFPNKHAIVRALLARYAEEMARLNQAAMPASAARLPIPEMVEGIVSPLFAFIERNPAYMEVYDATSDPRRPACMSDQVHRAIVGMVEDLMAARNPHVSPETRYLQASFAVELVHRMLEFAWSAPPGMRASIVQELKRTLALYSAMVETGRDPLKA